MKYIGVEKYIEARLVLKGNVQIGHLVDLFKMPKAQASKVLHELNISRPCMMRYDPCSYSWKCGSRFTVRTFSGSSDEALKLLGNFERVYGVGDPKISFIECMIALHQLVRRSDLASFFGTSLRTASRVIAKYNAAYPNNLKQSTDGYAPHFAYLPRLIKSSDEAMCFEIALLKIQ